MAEEREQEREANRQRIMEELRQKDEDEARKRERREAAKKAGEEKETREIVFGDKEWEDKMVARVKTIGTSLGTVETRDGRRFEGVMVKSARGDGLTLYHQGGQVTLAYGDLSEALQATFRYDAREAAAVHLVLPREGMQLAVAGARLLGASLGLVAHHQLGEDLAVGRGRRLGLVAHHS